MTPTQKAIEAAVKAIRDLRKARKAALPFMPYGTSKPIMDKDLAETAITAYLAAIAVDGLALVDVSILRDMHEAIEQTEDWHVANTANWLLYHQIGALIDAAASDGEDRE